MPLRGLTIVVASADPIRLRSALGLALSHVALGGTARVFLDTAAVPLVRTPITDPGDAAHIAAGLPGLAALIDQAFAADIRMTLCQAGVALTQATAADFDPRFAFGGMIGLLAELGDNRMVMA